MGAEGRVQDAFGPQAEPSREICVGDTQKSASSGNLFYFNKLYWLFDQVRSRKPTAGCSGVSFRQVDEDHDRRMTLKEPTGACY